MPHSNYFNRRADELFPFKVEVIETWNESTEYPDQVIFCLDNFGVDAIPYHLRPRIAGAVWTFNGEFYWFLHETDATLFKLKCG